MATRPLLSLTRPGEFIREDHGRQRKWITRSGAEWGERTGGRRWILHRRFFSPSGARRPINNVCTHGQRGVGSKADSIGRFPGFYSAQGCTKRLFPGCVNMGQKNCALMPVEGKQNSTYSSKFTQPGKSILGQPCMSCQSKMCARGLSSRNLKSLQTSFMDDPLWQPRWRRLWLRGGMGAAIRLVRHLLLHHRHLRVFD